MTVNRRHKPFKSIACLRSIVVTVEKVLHATQALRCIMKSYQVHPTERSASLRASRDLAPLHLANPCVTDRVYLASADSTMWALWLGKHKRRTCSCDPTHLPETTSSIWAFYPWRDRASAETKETLCCFCFFFVCVFLREKDENGRTLIKIWLSADPLALSPWSTITTWCP